MNILEMKRMILDERKSDDEVLDALKEFCADRYDGGGAVVPPTNREIREFEEHISRLLVTTRPVVLERFRDHVFTLFPPRDEAR
jgi:hypothetical protein